MIHLHRGRHVLAVSHTDFLHELNTYELQGRTATTDFVVRQSFGAFLHHRSPQALAALGCAAALAITTLWERQQQQQRTAANENGEP